MKNILISMLAIILLSWLLAPGCATREQRAPASSYFRADETPSWWGSDPTCAPGCPPGASGRW
jgi:hypothetical protein